MPKLITNPDFETKIEIIFEFLPKPVKLLQ